MLIIGLTGSIAMGKSEAAKILAKYGLPLFDSDAEVHQLYDSERGAALIAPLVPHAIVEKKVNREIITKAVVADKALLNKLELIVHGEIRQRRQNFIAEARQQGAKAVVVDIPLLFETNAQKEFDKTLVISSLASTQKARALARPQMTQERLSMILDRQLPDDEKRRLADVVIENNGSIAELKQKLIEQMKKWGI